MVIDMDATSFYKLFRKVAKKVNKLRHNEREKLILEKGVRVQEPQKYTLPSFEEGMIEVIIELGDDDKSSFSISYDHANDLYRKGLLIYLSTDYADYTLINNKYVRDKYVYFLSGMVI